MIILWKFQDYVFYKSAYKHFSGERPHLFAVIGTYIEIIIKPSGF